MARSLSKGLVVEEDGIYLQQITNCRTGWAGED